VEIFSKNSAKRRDRLIFPYRFFVKHLVCIDETKSAQTKMRIYEDQREREREGEGTYLQMDLFLTMRAVAR
jgi:hypothetical protein